ncbi:hypothetical protein LTR37_021579, partial [Vermiconidia calcicola]
VPEVDGSAKLFPSRSNPENGPSGFSKALARIIAEMEKEMGPLERFTLHDLRRTMATGLQRLGIRLEVTEAVLNHVAGTRGGLVGVYQRHEFLDEKRHALTAWAAEVERIGTDFTKRKSTHVVAETAEEIRTVLRAIGEFSEDPWAPHRLLVEDARAALDREVAGQPSGYRFKPREDLGWYLRRLIRQGRLVQHHIDQGAASLAAHEAALFGEAYSELQMKLAREELFLFGQRTRAERSIGGTNSRKGSDQGRVARVRHYVAKGDKLTEAYRNAAHDLGCGVSTVRGAWAKLKKDADATD